MGKKTNEIQTMTAGEINIIGDLRARNIILRNVVKDAINETTGPVQAALRTALDREIELSR